MIILVDDKSHQSQDFDTSDPEVLQALWNMEAQHFWFAARNRWILKRLHELGIGPSHKMLEVGCGSGNVTQFLIKNHLNVIGLDTSPPLIQKAHERCPEGQFVLGRLEDLPQNLCGPYDVIGFFDVLEHLEHPESLIKTAGKILKPGGFIIATVPALQSLYSLVDKLSGHKKRYEPGELTELLQSTGFDQIHENSIFKTTKVIQSLMRRSFKEDVAAKPLDPHESRRILIKNSQIPSAPINWALFQLCKLEQTFLGSRKDQGSTGASLMVTAKKPEHKIKTT